MTRTFTTHRPSGKPSWPLILFAGAEKTGKSWEAATFSGSDLIGRTLWIQLGEATAEEYGAVPGADYEVVDHDGSYRDLVDAAEWAVQEPRVDGKPNMIVVDSVTILWDMLSAEQQQIALRKRKPGANGEAKVTMDQWNAAKDRWSRWLNVLRRNDGPVILLARMDVVTLVDEGGQPTKNKDWKVKAEKNLPYDVGVIVSMPARGEAWLSGIQSTRLMLQEGEKRRLDDFSLDRLMRAMGLAEEGATVPRQYTASRPDADEAIADAGPEPRPAVRERRQAPVEDEWTRPAPDTPMATDPQIADMLDALGAVRGITEPAAKGAAVSAMVGRQIGHPSQLTYAEAESIRATLGAEAEAKFAAAAGPGFTPNDPEPAPGKKRMMHALFKQRGITDHDGRVELASRVLGGKTVETTDHLTASEVQRVINALDTGEIPAPSGAVDPNVAEALSAGIKRAETSDALANVSEAAWKAKDAGTITAEQHTALMDQSMAREAELSGQVRDARQAVSA
jgi:hypothetical protein